MYNQFVKNYKTYLEINSEGQRLNEYRLRIAKPIMGMTDLKLLESWKDSDRQLYEEAKNIIYEISRQQSEIHAFKAFSWELWGYGFDGEPADTNLNKENLVEQLTLVKLLLSTQYWQ